MPTGSPIELPSPSTSDAETPLSRTNLYLRGLSPQTTDKDLLSMCHGLVKHGKIVSTKVILDPTTSKCKGYGFIDLDNEQAAKYTLQQLQLKGVQVQMAKQQEQDPTNLYIANLPSFMTENDLEQMFKKYGAVVSTRILRNPSGLSKGVGFSRMESRAACDKIINALNGHMLPGSQEALLVKFADSGNKKRTPARDVTNISNLPIAYDVATAAAALQKGLYLPAYSPTTPHSSLGLLPQHYATTAGLANSAALYGAAASSTATWFPAANLAPQLVMQSAAPAPHSHVLPSTHTSDNSLLQQLIQPSIAQQQLMQSSVTQQQLMQPSLAQQQLIQNSLAHQLSSVGQYQLPGLPSPEGSL